MTPSRLPRRPLALLTIAALLSLTLSLGAPPASGLNPDGALEGYVRDAASSAPIPGAAVEAVHVGYGWTVELTTDAAGHFRTPLRPGEYDLVVSAGGYDPWTDQVGVGTGRTTWSNASLSAAAARNAVVRGYVTERSVGTPVTTGHVLAVDWFGSGYRNASALNASGYFELWLVPSWYDLATEGVLGYSPDTAFVYVPSGAVVWQNFTLDPNPLDGHVNGTVVDSRTFAVLPNATVDVEVDGLRLPTARANATGWFEVPVPSGWATITVDAVGYLPLVDTDYFWSGDAVTRTYYLDPLGGTIRGYVRDRDTGAPVPGSTVETSTWDGFYDLAVADPSGYFEIRVPADWIDLIAGAPGYASMYNWARPSFGQVLWVNFTIPAVNSHVQGYVIAADTGAHLPGVAVYVADQTSSFFEGNTTDGAGLYSLDAVSTTFLVASASASPGYSGGLAYGGTRPGRVTWLNVTVYPATATVRVTVRDAGNGTAIPGASVSLSWNYAYYDWDITGVGGSADLSSPVGPTAYVWASALGYRAATVTFPVLPGLNGVEILLYPDLPADVSLRGYVWDELGSPVVAAYVEVTGYDTFQASDYTDGSGYYSMSIVAARQTVRATDWGMAANATVVDPAPGAVVWLNLTLGADADPPRILSFTANPDVGVGPGRPTGLHASVEERSLETATLQYYRLYSVAGGDGTFQLVSSLPTYAAISTPAPGQFEANASWDATALGGYLDDGSSRTWWPASLGGAPNTRTVSGTWRNLTSGPLTATAIFDSGTGGLTTLVVSSVGYIYPSSQPASTFQPYSGGIVANLATDAFVSFVSLQGPTFQVSSLSLSVQDRIPTGTAGAYLSLYDSAGEWNASWVSFGVDVTPPVADAGGPYGVGPGGVVTLNGTRSYDDGGIVNYTWTFDDGGTQTLYGSTPSYRFMSPGTYVVTLVVRDAGGNTGSDTAVVTVGTDTTAPTAVAGSDRTVDEDVPVVLDGSASYDDFGIASYTWTFTDGTARTLTGPTAAYTFATPGVYSVTLTVRDAAGNEGTDGLVVTVRDLTAPTVAIDAPAAGATVSGVVDVAVSASDNAGVVRVELRVDGTLVATDAQAPFLFRLDTGTLAPGNHTIEVVAYDAAGNSATDARPIAVVPGPGLGALVYLGVGVAALVAAVLGVWLVFRRRRAAPPPPSAAPAPAPEPSLPPDPVPESPSVEGVADEIDRL